MSARKAPADAPASPSKRRAPDVSTAPLTAERGRRATPRTNQDDARDGGDDGASSSARKLFASGRDAPARAAEPADDAAASTAPMAGSPVKKGAGGVVGRITKTACSAATVEMYRIVRKATGSIGGNGHGGAIYGALYSGPSACAPRAPARERARRTNKASSPCAFEFFFDRRFASVSLAPRRVARSSDLDDATHPTRVGIYAVWWWCTRMVVGVVQRGARARRRRDDNGEPAACDRRP